MAKPSHFSKLVRTVTRDVTEHPRDLTHHYANVLNISRVAANRYIQRLEKEGWIARSGPSTHPVFTPGYKRRISKLSPLAGLEEHILWEADFRPYFALASNVQNIVHHGFTEMVNNAIDHSGGQHVLASMEQDETDLTLLVSDDGIGIFKKIADALNLPNLRQALFELSKGKLTTDPSRHTGEGVFFTSRMFDVFIISANGLEFTHSHQASHDLLNEDSNALPSGTLVFMRISLKSERTSTMVYDQFTDAPEDFGFSKTIVPMKLARSGDEQLVSRSQARRLIARFDRFKVVYLDFDGIGEIGQPFADELFRVYARSHLAVELVPRNMTKQVERMWLRATGSQPA